MAKKRGGGGANARLSWPALMARPRLPALATVAALAASALHAQTPERLDQIPVIPGARHDKKAEGLLPPPNDSAEIRLYRIEGSIEEMFKWYHFQLGGESGETLDSPTTPVRGITSVRYEVRFHRFDDECADSAGVAAPPTDATATCRKWRRGKDKERALALSRLPWDKGQWIAAATFTWFCRDANGTLRRLRVEIRDIGLKPDWKFYTPLGQVRIESVVLNSPPPP